MRNEAQLAAAARVRKRAAALHALLAVAELGHVDLLQRVGTVRAPPNHLVHRAVRPPSEALKLLEIRQASHAHTGCNRS